MREELDIPMPAMSPSYRVPRRHESNDNTKRLAIIAGGIGAAFVLLVGTWEAIGHRHTGVPVVEAASGPVKVKPANPGGMQVAGQDESILGGGQSDAKAALAPPPEAPALQALKAEAQAAAAPPKPAPVVVPPAPTPAPVTLAAAPEAKPAPKPVEMKPAPKLAEAKPVVKAPEMKPMVATKSPPPGPLAEARTVAAEGKAQVQLASLTSEQAAKAEWDRLAKKMPSMFGSHKPAVQKVDLNGHTFWRLRTGGFADNAQALGFCEQVKAKGGGCEVTRS